MKKITFILSVFVILFTLKGIAQTPNWQWATSGTGSGSEGASKMVVDNDGNVIVSGTYVAPMTLDGITVATNANNGGIPFFVGDLFIAKYNSTGNLLWVVYPEGVGSNLQSSVSDCTIDSSGNIYAFINLSPNDSASGLIFGNDTIFGNASGNQIGALTKFDPNGNLLWFITNGQIGFTPKLAVDNSGNIFLTDYFPFGAFTATYDTVTITNPHPLTFGEVAIFKFNSTGSALWAKAAGGIDRESPTNILIDNSGNFYLSGLFKSDTMYFDDSTYVLGPPSPLPNGNASDFFYAKYDTNGNVIWAKSIQTSGMGAVQFDITIPCAVNSNDELFFAGRNIGSTLNIGSITLNSPGYYAFKTDVNGDPVWATVIGDSIKDSPRGIQLDGFGNVYVLGTFNSDSAMMSNTMLYNAAPGTNTNDLFVATINSNGGLIGAFREGGDDRESPVFVVNDNSSMYLSGSFRSNSFTLGNTTLTNPNFPNGHLFLTYSSPLFTGLNEMNFNENISIYPNPATAEINLHVKNGAVSPSTVSILNPLGEIVYTKAISNELNSTIDVSRLPSGVYVLQVQDQKNVSSGKFIKY